MPMLTANEAQTTTIEELLIIRNNKSLLEAAEKLLENRIKAEIGENDGILSDLGKITWKATKDTEKVDWEALAAKFLVRLPMMFRRIHQGSYHHQAGVRRFLVSPSKLPVKGGRYDRQRSGLPEGERIQHRWGQRGSGRR